jgi:hypothetical protein
MQLEKIIQFLYKGHILISEASLYFIVPFIVEMGSSSIKIHALLTSQAFACFMIKSL